MKLRFFAWIIAVILIGLIFAPVMVSAADNALSVEKYLNIATIDTRSVSTDKIVYTALADMGYQADFTGAAGVAGYTLANDGERDGVISALPDMEESYPNLIKVPVPLMRADIYAFVRDGSGFEISGWDDLSGLKVGILTQGAYIPNRIPDSATIMAKESKKLVLEGLAQGEYHAVVLAQRTSEELVLPKGIVHSGKLDEFMDYLYVHKNNENLVPDITDAIRNVFADGRAGRIANGVSIPGIYRKRTVLHIISSSLEVSREEAFDTTLKEQFKNDTSVEWYTIELKAKRFSRDPNRLSYFAGLLRQDCVSRDIVAIIASGEEAMGLVKDYYSAFFPNVPVLFYGISEEYDMADELAPYFSGIVEKLSAYDTVSKALELFPDTKNIYVVNDYLSEGKNYRANIEKQLKPIADKINIEYNKNIEYDLLLEQIQELPQDSIVFVGSYFCDAKGRYFSQNDMKRFLQIHCNVPVFALYSDNVVYNSVGGKCLDYEKYGEIIADMLKRLLDGENVKNIPVITDSENHNRWSFDKNELDLWRIKEERLPAGSQVLNKIPSIWESNPRYAYSLLVLIVISIVAIVIVNIMYNVNRRQKRHLTVIEESVLKDRKVKEVKERLERIINTAPVAYMMSISGMVVEANEYIKRHIGVKTGDEVTQYYTDPDTRAALIERSSKQELLENQIIKLNVADGEAHRFLANFRVMDHEQQQAYILWGVDIEKSEIQRDRLEATQQSLQTILDTMPAPVVIVDVESLSIVYCNNAYLKTFGFKLNRESYGRHAIEMLANVQSDGIDPSEKLSYLINSEEPVTMEVQARTATGKTIDMRILTSPIDYKGKRSTLGVMTDLTAEKQAQTMLIHAAEKEKEANHLKSNFLINMSHEIRTPMNAIIGLTEIELRKNPTKETVDIYKKINLSAKNLLQIINDILDLSKIEADKMELFESEFELEDVFNSALLVTAPRLEGKNVELLLNASLDLPRFVIGDRTRFWQILKNFLDNSAKFTERGQIVLSAFINRVMSDDETVYITFIVEDTGIGISEDHMERLFAPYEQFADQAQKKYTGTGLGMPISKQLCEIMGGSLKVDSKFGEGTSTYVTIPFKRSKNSETGVQTVKHQTLAGMEILVVDDDDISLDIMAKLLEGSDAKCTLAHSGAEAMEIILTYRNMGKEFDAILLDYMMEGLNGIESARQIQLGLSRTPKILLVTAYQKMLLDCEIKEYGIAGVIEKPFIPSEFMNKLSEALSPDGKTSGDQENQADQEDTLITFKDAHVLICEDYRLNQEVVVGMLEQMGVTATVAENGKQGVDLLNGGESFDLVFMDLQMPVMDGYEATRIIRADRRFDSLPIISLTADAMTEVVDKCLETGMNDHIAKPIEFECLNGILLKWLPENKRTGDGVTANFGIDVTEQGLARFGGRRDLYEKALREFAEDLPEKWPDFSDAFENIEETKRIVHRIKGAAGNISETGIYLAATQLETSLRSNVPDKNLYIQFIDACNKMRNENAGKAEDTQMPEEAGTDEELAGHMGNLRDALQNYDPKGSSKIIEMLKTKIWPGIDMGKLKKLYELTLKYDFDAALDTLNEIEGEAPAIK